MQLLLTCGSIYLWLVSVSFVLVMEMYVNAFEGEENET